MLSVESAGPWRDDERDRPRSLSAADGDASSANEVEGDRGASSRLLPGAGDASREWVVVGVLSRARSLADVVRGIDATELAADDSAAYGRFELL